MLHQGSSAGAVDVTGAKIGVAPDPSQEREIYLPKHTEYISHVAIDIGGSLAKVVYFTRTPRGKERAIERFKPPSRRSSGTELRQANGVLEPKSIGESSTARTTSPEAVSPSSASASTAPARRFGAGMMRRRSSTSQLPGGRLNFVKFETDKLDECIEFISDLIESSAQANNVSLSTMKKGVKIMATGGGAHMYYERLQDELGVEVRREEEMDCLITGLNFITEIPDEVFWYSDELAETPRTGMLPTPPAPSSIGLRTFSDRTEASMNGNGEAGPSKPPDLPRPSPNPPQYELVFESTPAPQFPFLLVNIGSGVSIVKVTDYGQFERISGTSLGGGTLWGILSMLTQAESFDEMLELSETGDNANVDMLVGDIYGSDYNKIGLKSTTIASSFGKVFRRGEIKRSFSPNDIARSLLYAISNNIGQIAYLNAEQHNIDTIYFGGCFIRGHAATISTLSYAIRFWSKGKKRALFLRHEGFLGSIGAWLKNVQEETSSL